MNPDLEKLDELKAELKAFNATLVAVSKTKPVESVMAVYQHGHRDFGENYVQELVQKHGELPSSIHWHFIGHLQSNKVKLIAPFVHLIHGIDSNGLAAEVSKQALKNNRVIDVLLQVHISDEITKFGLSGPLALELAYGLIKNPLPGIRIRGLMGMASLTDNEIKIGREFRSLKKLFDEIGNNIEAGDQFNILSMGMSSDYKIALEEGSNMVRIGSAIFGERA
jgi:PLP dependent protein